MSFRLRFVVFNGLLLGMSFLFFFTRTVSRASSAADLNALAAAPAPAAAEASQPQPEPSGECSLSSAFPQSVRDWCALIESSAVEAGLDPGLVAAVVTVESAGDPSAYSVNGAVGLMQVMPSDGPAASFMCLNGPCFSSRPSSAELFDPSFNLAYGTGMLASLIARHGTWRDALVAYGPMDAGYQYADLVLEVYENAY